MEAGRIVGTAEGTRGECEQPHAWTVDAFSCIQGGGGVTRSAMHWISLGKNTVSREVQSDDARTQVECSRFSEAKFPNTTVPVSENNRRVSEYEFPHTTVEFPNPTG